MSEITADEVNDLDQRLVDGDGRPCLFLPFLGEFGHEVMSHVRIVHFHTASAKTVCCRAGQEVLYPSADAFVTDWVDPVPDLLRVASGRNVAVQWPEIIRRFPDHHTIISGRLTRQQEIHPLRPDTHIPMRPSVRGLRADLVFGVRRRIFCPERNFKQWDILAAAATAAGLTFAVIGDKATSFDLPGQVCHSGDFDTDAAVELLQNCRLYVGTDSGNSHLAAAVGARMLIFRQHEGGSRDLTGRMAAVNPGRVEVLHNGWNDVFATARRMTALVKAASSA